MGAQCPGQMWATDYLYLRGNLGSAQLFPRSDVALTQICWEPRDHDNTASLERAAEAAVTP